MRPEDRMAMAVVLGLAERAPGLAQSPETCEWIRQAVANEGRAMRQEVAHQARVDALEEARILVAKELGWDRIAQRCLSDPTWRQVEKCLDALGDLGVRS